MEPWVREKVNNKDLDVWTAKQSTLNSPSNGFFIYLSGDILKRFDL